MGINKNHEFDELEGVKCAIVEKNVFSGRVEFLRKLLTFNRYIVIAVPSPAPKAAPAPKTETTDVESTISVTPETFTVGVTDYTFNTINALYGRLLKTPDGHIVTPAYWQQKESVSHDEVPYYEKKF